MRITHSMYYKTVFSPNKTRISEQLFNVNKQISSGMKIEYAKDDISVFSDTMRLDNEITTLEQAKTSTQNALKLSTQTDKTLNDFQKTLDRMKVLMVNAANATHDSSSLDAIYRELKGLRDHLKNLSNTSIDGQYLFSGTALDTKPIDDNGRYHGNDKALKAFAGSNIQIQYNVTGKELFLGEESQNHRRVTTNVKNYNQSELYPDIMKDPAIPRETAKKLFITADDTIRDLMGDTDTDPTNDPVSHFYLQGQKHDGTSFKKQIDMNSTQSVGELLSAIEDAYGRGTVDVTLNEHGQIEVKDKIQGSSKLKFHLVGAVDFNQDGNATDDADLNFETSTNTLADLQNRRVFTKAFMDSGYTSYTSDVVSLRDKYDPSEFSINGEMLKKADFSKASVTTPLNEIFPNGVDHIALSGVDTQGNAVSTNFSTAGKTVQDLLNALDTAYDADNSLQFRLENGKITFTSANATSQSNILIQMQTQDAASNAVDGFAMDSYLAYDGVKFAKQDNVLTGNVAQIVTADNSYATKSTKLSEVADLSQANVNTLDGTKLELKGIDTNGNAYLAEIDLKSTANGGSTFSVDTNNDGVVDTTYPIYNVANPRAQVDADEMTYGQLGDVVNMIVTNNLPVDSDSSGTIDPSEYDTAAENAGYVGNVDLTYDGRLQFSELNKTNTKAEISLQDITQSGGTNTPPALSFNLNDAITITDPKNDFFKQIDTAIESVNLKRVRPDSEGSDPRNIGIQNAIQVIDDVSRHVEEVHSKIGALSNSLDNASQRSELLSVSTKTLRSDVLDTDIAEASLKLNQLTINYQAILSTIGRVSQLSLVNYLR